MSGDVYAKGLVNKSAFHAKTPVVGRLVAILDMVAKGRDLDIIAPLSRAVLRNDIHEIVVTNQEGAGPRTMVRDVSYLGFFEILEGGIVLVGDRIRIGGLPVGEVAGFDLGHFPNHMNIVLKRQDLATGAGLGLRLGQEVVIDSPG